MKILDSVIFIVVAIILTTVWKSKARTTVLENWLFLYIAVCVCVCEHALNAQNLNTFLHYVLLVCVCDFSILD